MADDVKTAMGKGGDAAKAAADRMAGAAQDAGEAMKESSGKIAEGGATIGRTMIDQAEQNTREAFAAMREAANAKDLSQVMKIQGDYLREQSQRSMTQAREIGEMIMKFGKDAVAPLRNDGSR
ncbi:phasin family protein [Sphingomonas sp. 4RDLI-65]|uniref:phasin family protein n=1 Tax=Sphingomonas sp. 4RDLI-65 TaxID=3111641 RepID=UPI003C1B1B23